MCAMHFDDFKGIREYIEPKTLAEACSFLSQHQGKAKVIAGGTALAAAQPSPEIIINLLAVPNVDRIDMGDQGLKIGALATLHKIENSMVVRGKYPIVAQAVHEVVVEIGQRWMYYMATIGGTLCNAVSLDIAPALIALGSKAKIQGPKGWRTIPMEEFFTGIGKTVLQSDEILVEIEIQNPPPDSGLSYFRKKINDTAVSVATLLKLDSEHTIVEDVRIVLATPGLIRALEAEEIIKGKSPEERLVKKAAGAAVSGVTSGQDAIKELVTEALLQSIDNAVGDFAMGY
jgi:aerobic carbon-monoxide dehydrogenase medium subunit